MNHDDLLSPCIRVGLPLASIRAIVSAALTGGLLAGCGGSPSDVVGQDAAGSDTGAKDGAAEAAKDGGAHDDASGHEAGGKDASNQDENAKADGPGACAGPHSTSCDAVTETVASNDLCTALTVFYYELGNSTTTLISGTGGQHYAATTGDTTTPAYRCLNSGIGTQKDGCPASIDVTSRTQKVTWASASKWVYGAFAAETQQVAGGGPASVPMVQQPYMNFTSGYTNMSDNGKACSGSTTPDDCLALNPLYTETVAADVGVFDYDSGHFENHAGTFGSIGTARSGPAGLLTSSVIKGLGITWTSFYTSPLMAGGLYGPIADYVTLLQAIMTGDLAIAKDMTFGAACTQDGVSYTVDPSGKSVTPFTCKAGTSPFAPAKAYYSFGHWIETDPAFGGDDSFSSAGSYGVYPALTADLSLYEVVSRDAQPAYYSAGQQGFASLRCGASIRKAWLTGVKQ
jgi:hypothetical protein